jgi:hypothetical protein
MPRFDYVFQSVNRVSPMAKLFRIQKQALILVVFLVQCVHKVFVCNLVSNIYDRYVRGVFANVIVRQALTVCKITVHILSSNI